MNKEEEQTQQQDKRGRPRLYATEEEAKVMHRQKRMEWKERNKYYVTCQYCGRRIKKYLLSRHRKQKVCREKQQQYVETKES